MSEDEMIYELAPRGLLALGNSAISESDFKIIERWFDERVEAINSLRLTTDVTDAFYEALAKIAADPEGAQEIASEAIGGALRTSL